MSPLTRRRLLQALAASPLAAAACSGRGGFAARVDGEIQGASAKIGHLLRAGVSAPIVSSERKQVVIAGGGIAGLSAAHELGKAGIRDIVLLDLEREVGGNASWGENSVSRYPWGAHYVPVPNRETEHVIALFEELGVITGRDPAGEPVYDEQYLCHAPEERLFMFGGWQDGIVPNVGAAESDRKQLDELFEHLREMRNAVGADGRPAFAIPIDLSSADTVYRDLDRESFAEYLDRHGWTSPYLRWYTNYCCRDDYGTTEHATSAWAGIHYFAARRGFAANADDYHLLTWPEGNGWIVKRLKERISAELRTNSLVCSIAHAADADGKPVERVKVLSAETRQATEIVANAVIYAAPRFTAKYVMPGLQTGGYCPTYAPWMVANLTVQNYRKVGDLAWDNVSYHSDSLGYVVATHQLLQQSGTETVLTYYWPLSGENPDQARSHAVEKSHAEWSKLVLEDLKRYDPQLASCVRRVDVWVWGHAMVRPVPGSIWNSERASMQVPFGRVFFAHSDMSGCSIFEEAQFRGVTAARQVIEALRV